MTRTWAAPTRTDALRLTILSDIHAGRREFTAQALEQTGPSVDAEAARTDVFLNLGDSIHWRLAQQRSAQDAMAAQWLGARSAATRVPWHTIGGNHDLASYGAPYPIRSGDQWAGAMGLPIRSQVIDPVSWVRILMVTPTYQGFNVSKPGHEPMELNDDEVAWIRDRAREVPDRRVLVCFHAPIPPHYTGHIRNTDALMAMLNETTNIVAWVSGHRHMNPFTDTRCVMNLNIGTRVIHALNVPTFGGVTPGYVDDRWGQPFLSTHVSVLPEGGIEVRFRDHMLGRWMPWAKTGLVTTLPPNI